MADRAVSPAERGPASGTEWKRGLLPLPGALLSLLPAASCPACAAAYAGALSALGLGLALQGRLLTPLIAALLAAGLASLALSARVHRRAGPLFLAVPGAGAVAGGRLLWDLPITLYAGVALLVLASAWNLMIGRRRAPLVQIRRGRT